MKALKPYFILYFYLKSRRKIQVLFLIIFALTSHILEIISLTSVLFFIDIILNINSYKNNNVFLLVNNFFNFEPHNPKLFITFLFLGVLIISTLAKKSIMGL